MRTRPCAVCGTPFDYDGRHAGCDACQPVVGQHVVSMRTAPGEALAVCPCGWTHRTPWTREGIAAREAEVHAHWRAMVAAAG